MREGIAGAGLKKQISSGQRLQSNQLPTISPLLDGWQLSGWTEQSDSLGGDFHDWFCLPDGLLATAVGHAMDRGVEAALAATAMKAALRAHGQYCREAHHALKRLNLTTWTGSAGDQHGTLFYGLIQTSTGRICCSSAGNPGVIVVRPRGWQSLSVVSPRLGESPESDFAQYGYELQPGEALVIFTEGVCDAIDAQGRPFGESGVAESLMGHLDLSADQLAALVRGRIDSFATAPGCRDRTVLVVKRTSIA
jgi:serine phosphatase RsbU (regulator of sigma subunit)